MLKYFKIWYYFVKENLYYWQSILARSIFLILLCIIITTLVWVGVNFNELANVWWVEFKYYIWYIWVAEIIVLSTLSYDWFEEILAWNVSVYLAKPLDFLYFFWWKIIWWKIIMILILALFSFPIILAINKFNLLWLNFVPLILILPLVLFLSTLIDAIAVLISFWLEKAIFVGLIVQKMYFVFWWLFFPISIYPKWAQVIAWWLPFAYIVNLPAKVFTSEDLSFLIKDFIFVKLIVWILVLIVLNIVLYKMMIKRIEINGG